MPPAPGDNGKGIGFDLVKVRRRHRLITPPDNLGKAVEPAKVGRFKDFGELAESGVEDDLLFHGLPVSFFSGDTAANLELTEGNGTIINILDIQFVATHKRHANERHVISRINQKAAGRAIPNNSGSINIYRFCFPIGKDYPALGKPG